MLRAGLLLLCPGILASSYRSAAQPAIPPDWTECRPPPTGSRKTIGSPPLAAQSSDSIAASLVDDPNSREEYSSLRISAPFSQANPPVGQDLAGRLLSYWQPSPSRFCSNAEKPGFFRPASRSRPFCQ